MKGLLVGAVLGFQVVSLAAGDGPVCNQAVSSGDPEVLGQLSAILLHCAHPGLTRLHHNRTQLIELMHDFNSLNRAVSADKSAQANYEAYRIFIALAESFAVQAMAAGDLTALDRLNETYRRYIELTELRLKGYDLIANRLERGLR